MQFLLPIFSAWKRWPPMKAKMKWTVKRRLHISFKDIHLIYCPRKHYQFPCPNHFLWITFIPPVRGPGGRVVRGARIVSPHSNARCVGSSPITALPITGCIGDMMYTIWLWCMWYGKWVNGAYGAEIDIRSTRPKKIFHRLFLLRLGFRVVPAFLSGMLVVFSSMA